MTAALVGNTVCQQRGPLRVTRTTAEAPNTTLLTPPRGDQHSKQNRNKSPCTGSLTGSLDLLQPRSTEDWSIEGPPRALGTAGRRGPPPPPPWPKNLLRTTGFSGVTTHKSQHRSQLNEMLLETLSQRNMDV